MSSEDDTFSDFSTIILPTQSPANESGDQERPVIDPTFLNDNPEWKTAREQVVSVSLPYYSKVTNS